MGSGGRCLYLLAFKHNLDEAIDGVWWLISLQQLNLGRIC